MQDKVSIDIYLYENDPEFDNAGSIYDSLRDNYPKQSGNYEF